jgi:hypothetical protein
MPFISSIGLRRMVITTKFFDFTNFLVIALPSQTYFTCRDIKEMHCQIILHEPT